MSLVHTDEKRVIEQITEILNQILRGKKPEPIQYENGPEALRILIKHVNEIVYSVSEIWDFILPLSQGILNINPPGANNLLASPFKELHSQLRTLVWQVQQVAKGDYKQRVVFMGEFSEAFNSMVEALEEKDRLISEHIHHLETEARKLKDSEARYSTAVRNSPGGIFIFDPATMSILESNDQFNIMMGYSKEEILQLTVYDFYEDKSIAEKDLNDILSKSLHTISNRQYCLKNGGCLEVDINTCWSVSGHSNVVIVSVRDVTERNKAQEIAAKYKVLLENARDIIMFVRLDGRILEANKAAEDAYGYSRSELLTLNIYDLHNQNDRLVIEQYMQDASFGGITYETINVRKDGSTFPVEVSSQGVVIGKQKILGQVIRDITDRKRIEENLRYFASYDALTGVPNRRVLEETYNKMFGSIRDISQMNNTGALLLIDIDNFKGINDTYGHIVGDHVLQQFAGILKSVTRENDIAVRWGGEEFAVILYQTEAKEAFKIADRIRKIVEEHIFSYSNITCNATVSIGIATAKADTNIDIERLFKVADKALYEAKEKRNCVTY